jgi:UDP-2,3-diacylglucosamine pyrophosphatase LpxH
MRKFLQILLWKPVLRLAAKFSSKPDKKKIFEALSRLLKTITEEPGKRGVIIPFDITHSKFIIFSDQHRGAKDGSDDFAIAEPNYLAALDHYYQQQFYFISLGDSEELWENSLTKVKKHNELSFAKEKLFIQQNRFVKIFGNHDLYWDNDPFANLQLKNIYEQEVKVYEGVVLQSATGNRQSATGNTLPENRSDISSNKETQLPIADCRLTFFLTHGHQGDASSDGNWFSKFFVARIWAPLQAYLKINPNTPAYDANLKTKHNHIMYEWSSQQKDLILITGHTHQPVFESLTHLERLYKKLQQARNDKDVDAVKAIETEIMNRKHKYTDIASDYLTMSPAYFNTGCCCFSDGDITGIEIADGFIRLIKWSSDCGRVILEEATLVHSQELLQ